MTSTDQRDRDNERRLAEEKARRRDTKVRRTKDIIWTSVIASIVTIVVVLSLGWLTTQAVVEKARQEGKQELVALRASICLVKFQQRPDSAAKIAEFKPLSYSDKDTAIRKFVEQEGLATMLGEDAPVAGAVEKCATAIKQISS